MTRTVAVKVCFYKTTICRGLKCERFSVEAGFLDGQALVVDRGVRVCKRNGSTVTKYERHAGR